MDAEAGLPRCRRAGRVETISRASRSSGVFGSLLVMIVSFLPCSSRVGRKRFRRCHTNVRHARRVIRRCTLVRC